MPATALTRIAGVTNGVINAIADRITRGEADTFTAVREAAAALVGINTIEQNMRIINARGSVFQAIRLYNEANNDLNMQDELVFSSQLAVGYVREHIAARVAVEVSYRQAVAHTEQEEPARAVAPIARATAHTAPLFAPSAPPADDTCPICMCSHTEAPGDWCVTRCNHTFHIGCITRWGRNTCPMCRGNL